MISSEKCLFMQLLCSKVIEQVRRSLLHSSIFHSRCGKEGKEGGEIVLLGKNKNGDKDG